MELLHRFELGGKRFAIDTDTCFCFECDDISWDVVQFYPEVPVNAIIHRLSDRHDPAELEEVIGELEWLRSTKSILPRLKPEDQQKRFELQRGLKEVIVFLPAEGNRSTEMARLAITLLFGSSAQQTDLAAEFRFTRRVTDPAPIEEAERVAGNLSRVTAKKFNLRVAIEDLAVSSLPPQLSGHRITAVLERTGESPRALKDFESDRPVSLSGLAKRLNDSGGRVRVRPGHADFGDAVRVLHEAGFSSIELDIEGSFATERSLAPTEVLAAMRQAAQYYAEQLLHHRYFRVEPLASLFWRIYNGTPSPRVDPAGTHSLTIAADGGIFPSPFLRNGLGFRTGSILDGSYDPSIVKPFEDIGAATTAPCIACWARNVCGGGHAAVHHLRTGSIHTPDETWCNAQRAWLEAAVASFNLLSSAGVNFQRLYQNLDRTVRPSLFKLARAAFRMHIGMRPIEERDAQLLTTWENWNPSAYFLLNERAIVLGNQYSHEMDAVHPRPFELEAMLLRKDGSPLGLFKVRPELLPGVAEGFVYLRNPADYESGAIQRSFRTILKEASTQQDIRTLTVSATASESGLHRFLAGVGFVKVGVLREAVYTRGAYHDVAVFRATIDQI